MSKIHLFWSVVLGFLALLLTTLFWPTSGVAGKPKSTAGHAVTVATSDPDTPGTVPLVAIAPDIQSQKDAPQFELYKGIKDVMDSLILSADSNHTSAVIALANAWCKQQNLSVLGCQQFQALLSRYLEYKIALQAFDLGRAQPQDGVEELQARLQIIEDLRYQWFSKVEIDALFSQDTKLAKQALARRSIAMDPNLDKAAKQQLLAAHFAELPDEEKQALQPSLNMLQIQHIKSHYQEPQTRLLELENHFGVAAAQRLQNTWQQQSQFKKQIEAIATKYHGFGSDEAGLEARRKLLAKHFTGNQLRRAKVLLTNQSLLNQ